MAAMFKAMVTITTVGSLSLTTLKQHVCRFHYETLEFKTVPVLLFTFKMNTELGSGSVLPLRCI